MACSGVGGVHLLAAGPLQATCTACNFHPASDRKMAALPREEMHAHAVGACLNRLPACSKWGELCHMGVQVTQRWLSWRGMRWRRCSSRLTRRCVA